MDLKKTITLFLLSSICLHASPHKMKTQKGSAALSQEEAHTTIRCSDKTILHWNSFSIGEKEKVEFVQPHKDAAVLNRVTGSDKSQILGQLCASGNLFLVNPNGLVIGPNAKIVATTFIASTLDILDEDFLGGKEIFFSGQSDKTIENRGFIKGRDGAIFIARSIKNSGNIEAKETSLIGAGSVLYKPHAHQKFYLQVDTLEEGEVENSGYIKSLSAQILANGAYEKAIHHTGTLEAYDLKEENGTVTIIAKEGENYIDGEITAANGDISLLGEKVTLSDNAQINASGKNPGNILIGGDFQGKNPDIQNAKKTYVGTGASIKADSLDNNDGGRVIVWSDEYIFYDGHISARGGPNGGDGGFVELSGKKGGHISLHADLFSPQGKAGELLLDPTDINFVGAATDTVQDYAFGDPPATADLWTGPGVNSIADYLSNTGSLTLQATNDITNNAAGATISSSSANNFTLNAGQSINLSNLTISLSGGNFTATINTSNAGSQTGDDPTFTGPSSLSTGGGDVSITHGDQNGQSVGPVIVNTINAGGGDITIEGVGFDTGATGGDVIGVTCNGNLTTTGSGAITITGEGYANSTSDAARGVTSGNDVTSQTGNITITGTGTGTGMDNHGVNISTNTISTNGVITIRGFGSTSGTTTENIGIFTSGTEFSSDSQITLDGTGGTGTNNNEGIVCVLVNFSNMGSNNINMIGTGGNGSGTGNHGIDFGLGFTINGGSFSATGTGGSSTNTNHGIHWNTPLTISNNASISLTGTGGGTGNDNYGVSIEEAISTDGDITLDGTGGGSSSSTGNHGINVDNLGIATSAGSISLTGRGGSGTTDNKGINLTGGALTQIEITAGSGNLTATGTGGGSGSDNEGVFLEQDARLRVSAAGTGNVSVTGSPGGTETDGILVQTGGRIEADGTSSGSVTVNTTSGDCHIANNGGVRSDSVSPINCTIARDLLLEGGAAGNAFISIDNAGSSAEILAKAGRNITFSTATNEGQITNDGSGNIRLVCDNLFPNFPDIGNGAFTFGSSITGNSEVRIYTAERSLNTVNDPINGQVFTPGTFGVDNTNEKWSVYFPEGDYDAGAAFTFYYKVPIIIPPTPAAPTSFVVHQLQIAQTQLTKLFPLWRNKYIFKVCKKNRCLLDPYDYFVYWPFRWEI